MIRTAASKGDEEFFIRSASKCFEFLIGLATFDRRTTYSRFVAEEYGKREAKHSSCMGDCFVPGAYQHRASTLWAAFDRAPSTALLTTLCRIRLCGNETVSVVFLYRS